MKSEFEEKSYESAFNIELAGANPGRIFSPGQVAEMALGFDVLAHVAQVDPFWAAVALDYRTGYRPRAAGVPDEVFNVFLQYKRSEHLVGATARHRAHFGGDYFRFKVDDPAGQRETLQKLECAVGTNGHVRYAAPEFATLAELCRAQRDGEVMKRSVTVAPSVLGSDHTAYNFKAGIALANPDPEDVPVEDAPTLFAFDNGGAEPRGFLDGLRQITAMLTQIAVGDESWTEVAGSARAALSNMDAPDGSFEFLAVAGIAWVSGTQWIVVGDHG